MPCDFPSWPRAPYSLSSWPDHWLRFETQYPGSGRPSRLASHSVAPYVIEVADALPDRASLGAIASDYLDKLETYLQKRKAICKDTETLDIPLGWDRDLVKNGDDQNVNLMHWLDIWPPIGTGIDNRSPQIASWNLSRNALHDLPATIIMVATEFVDGQGEIAQFTTGFTVPMLVEPIDGGFRVIISSMTAEYPNESRQSWSSANTHYDTSHGDVRRRILDALTNKERKSSNYITDRIGESASVVPSSINFEQIDFVSKLGANSLRDSIVIETISKARGAIERLPEPLSYLVVNRIEATPVSDGPDSDVKLRLLGSQTSPLVTHVDAGEARVFVQTPPASVLPFDPTKPNAAYEWVHRRPTRTDEILDRFRETVTISQGPSKVLEGPGFRIRRCPTFVPEDASPLVDPEGTKVIDLPAHNELPPRSNEFSALSAYYNCADFFQMLGAYGIDPTEFVARAEPELQVYYRYGIVPGPGKDGRTINAQVAYDCKADGATRPIIRMNLALAEMSRWDRPKNSEGERTWAQPLGIAADKRWILHEFGHYLLAARIGKLEFDFAHSAGDAMAAIACDPASRLADPRNGVADSFRGITYPFVFSTRRHDRSPTLGWAWYGELNRSVIEAPPTGCEDLKGYLTEQILSTSLFRLYRALGGDSMDAGAPDVYLRQRASFLTLYLLVKSIHALGQSPSKAEMLELGMEQVGRLQADILFMDPQPVSSDGAPLVDGWKGGLTHKVVRWAFETQGMFVEHPEKIHNGAGRPPAVDVYIADQRPLSEMVNGSRFTYGPGSYCPVSLDWDDAALWQMPAQVRLGNRGFAEAKDCALRIWFGYVFNPAVDWGLTSNIKWLPDFIEDTLQDIAAGEQRSFQSSSTDAKIAQARQEAEANASMNSSGFVLMLFELSCPDDRANTDPLQHLAVGVGADPSNLPLTPRALTDLVANDNNLGLRVIRVL